MIVRISKTLIVSWCATAALLASDARAALFKVSMTGDVETVSAGLSGVFNTSQTLSVSYLFDSDASPRAGSNSQFAFYDALVGFSFAIGGYSASSSGASEIQVDNNPPAPFSDRYGVVSRASQGLTGADVNGLALDAFSFRLDDSTNAVFSDALDLPTMLSLSLFDSSGFFAFFESGELVSGRFTNLTISQVPLPAALPLFGAGLAALGLSRRRKRKAAP